MIEKLKQKLDENKELLIRVKVRPGAKRNEIKDIMDNGVVKINIVTAPEKGKANETLINFLAKEFEVLKSDIKIIKGQASQFKTISILYEK